MILAGIALIFAVLFLIAAIASMETYPSSLGEPAHGKNDTTGTDA